MTVANHTLKHPDEHFRLLYVGNDAGDQLCLTLVETLAVLRDMTALNVTLCLVADCGQAQGDKLLKRISTLNLGSAILLPGMLAGESLIREYRRADLFLQSHGTEKPDTALLAALLLQVPLVLATDSSADCSAPRDWQKDAPLLLTRNDPAALAATIATLMTRPDLRRSMVIRGLHWLEALLNGSEGKELRDPLAQLTGISSDHCQGAALDFRIEGPFDSSYSLAIVNNQLALALSRQGLRTGLYDSQGEGLYEPDPQFLLSHPDTARLADNARSTPVANTVLRLMYPMQLSAMGGINGGLGCYGWEESVLPHPLVEQVNHHCHLATTMSAWVSKVLVDNGVTAPLYNTGIGADHILSVTPDSSSLPELGEGLRFLHISSCFPRKGVDVLLEAYGTAFVADDSVSLVIKTFPNIHHDIDNELARWRERYPSAPAVTLINRDLNDGVIRALYRECQVLVAPSRGEGFGLPLAEAMLHHMPVITTGCGGQREFCDDTTSWLVDYQFARADTHMNLMNSVWVEPDAGSLARLMKGFRDAWQDGKWDQHVAHRTRRARALIETEFTWNRVAQRVRSAVASSRQAITSTPKLAVVSTWNTKCGIATYSKLLFTPAFEDCWILANDNAELLDADGERVIRCWTAGNPDYPHQLFCTIMELGVDQVHIQFNFGFFSATGLKALLADLHAEGIQTFVTFHSTAGGWMQDNALVRLAGLQPELSRITRIFVHSVPDLNRLKSSGAVDNVCLFPHGVVKPAMATPSTTVCRPVILAGCRVIASYGFLLPHKGIRELIEAFALLHRQHPDTHLLLVNAGYPQPLSVNYAISCENLIRRLDLERHVTLITDFLDDSESFAWLANADILVFPYQHTLESSSAAVRWGLATGQRVYCTPLNIFDDVSEAVSFLPGTTSAAIAEGLLAALSTPPEQVAVSRLHQQRWLDEHDWGRLSRRLQGIMLATHRQSLQPH